MTSIVEFLDELRQSNISLWVENERLRYRAPKDALSAECLEQIKARKNEIIAFLKQANTQHQTQLPALAVIDRKQTLPLSFAQQRLWFLQQLAPDSTSNNMPVVVMFEGLLDIEILRQSIQKVVRRHEVLRTRFPVDGSQPRVLVEDLTVALPVVDLRHLSATESDAEAYRLATEEACQPFDLVNGPIFRCQLFRIKDHKFLFIWNMHCIICDGASSDVFYQDLVQIYQGFKADLPSTLPVLPVQYIDFAHWQRQWLQGEILETQLSYWKNILVGSLPLLQLPFDYPRPRGKQAYKGGRAAKMLPLELNQAVLRLGQQMGATQFMILLAAFEVLLYRYSSQDKFLINVASAGRGNVETEGLLGFFSNTLLLKAELSGNPTFRNFLLRVKQTSLEAFTHQDIPFAKVIEEVHAEQHTQDSLFQVKFALNPPWSNGRGMAAVELPELTITSLFGYIYHGETKYDLTLVMREQDEGLGMVFDYNADIFAADTIARMVEHFHVLLQGIVQNPDQPISTLPLLSGSELRMLLQEKTSPIVDSKPMRIHEIFEDQVYRHPDAIALTTHSQQLTYRDLNIQANQLAHYLKSLGVIASTSVAICLEKSVAMIVAQLAVLKAGAIYIPICTNFPREEREKIISAAQSKFIIMQPGIFDQLKNYPSQMICLDFHQDNIQNQSHTNPRNITNNDVACILFNTEGVGANITHQGIAELVQDTEGLNLSSRDRVLQWASPMTDISLFEIYTALFKGSQLIIPTPQIRFKGLGEVIDQYKITTLHLPARLFNYLVENELENLQSVRHCLMESALVSPYHAEKVLKALPQCCLYTTYSVLEATGIVGWQNVQLLSISQSSPQNGPPLSGVNIYILDHHLQPLPIGVEGNLYLGGTRIAKGYLTPPHQTQKNFIPNPFSGAHAKHQQSEYLFFTGERAKRLSDGSIVRKNRDNQAKVLDQVIWLSEVELALMQHPQIKECKLVVLNEPIENQPYLVAYVAAKQQSLTSNELYSFLKPKLPSHLIPANFVVLEALPLTQWGEVDLENLPLPSTPNYSWEEVKIPAQNALEHQLTEIWEQVLKVQGISTTENFFELGGNSLLAMSLAISIEQKLGKTLPLASFFQAPTIRELALVLHQEQPQSDGFSLVPIQPHGTRPPLFCVHFILRPLTNYLGSDQPIYALRYGIAAQTTQSSLNLPKQVEKLAAHYIQEMKRIQPVGPYHLMGSSFGGTIAFEMAQQLNKQGEDVALLAIFDTSMWPRPKSLSADKDFVKRLQKGVPGLKRSFKYRWRELQFKFKNKGRYTPHFYWDDEGYLFEPYHPQFYAGKVLLFHALAEAAKYQDPSWLPTQWDQTVAVLDTFNLPGDHNGILQEPYVHDIVEILLNSLDTFQIPPPELKLSISKVNNVVDTERPGI